ncbi:hypothetical protein NKI91_30500 [Mesorhizobium sp. M0312]|uniref:hypothetical protein n=1 Tax=Mesorhizobium sp. M0312 TaxID=2956934 RepID=UPI0033380824
MQTDISEFSRRPWSVSQSAPEISKVLSFGDAAKAVDGRDEASSTEFRQLEMHLQP